jgi:PKD repeat protein
MRPLALLSFFAALCLGAVAFAQKTVVGEDNQVFTGLSPLPSDPYKLHSRPGAPRTIYLDFTGSNPVVNSPWNAGATINIPRYSGTAQNIKNIWTRVADAFAPFNVDVTTELPVGGIPLRSPNFQRCLIGGNPFMVTDPLLVPAGTVESLGWWTGGNSYLSSATNPLLIAGFDEIPCFVFPDPPFVLSEMQVAGAICHQLGHTLGLGHKGVTDTIQTEWNAGHCSKDGIFYFGHGNENAADSWGPLMGAPVYGQNRQTWAGAWYVKPTMTAYTVSLGGGRTTTEYWWDDNSSNRTDEIAVLRGILGDAPVVVPVGDFIPGSSVGQPASLCVAGGTFLRGGLQHSFSFMANPGPISIGVRTVQPVGLRAPFDTQVVSNLKVSLSLSDERGRQLFRSVRGAYPEQGAVLNFTATKSGIYRLTITSVGTELNPDGSAYGIPTYSATPFITTNPSRSPVGSKGVNYDYYASAGKYSLLGSWTAPTYVSPSTTISTSATAPVPYDTSVNFSGLASSANIGNTGLFTYDWDFGDPRSVDNTARTVNAATSNVSHVYRAPGTYTVKLIATDSFGKASVVTTRTVTVTGSKPAAMSVGSLAASPWRRVNSVSKSSTVTIKVVDQYGLNIQGAVVAVAVTGTVAGKPAGFNVSVRTDVNGNAVVTSPSYPLRSTGTLTYKVASLTPPANLKATYLAVIAPAGGTVVTTIPVVP